MSENSLTVAESVRQIAKKSSLDLPDVVVKKKKKILDEETYVEDLQQIIQRDFFPDLPKWKAQAEYYDAIESNDLVKLRQIQMKYGLRRPETGTSSIYNSPATFETPEPRQNQKSPTHHKETNADKEDDVPDQTEKVSLDEYLSKNTSEDNASFGDILKATQQKHREKHAWLYEKELKQDEEHQEKLALPNIEQQAIQGPPPCSIHTWRYNAKNSLMYLPDGAKYTPKEIIKNISKKQEIVHDNTRFHLNPFNSEKNKEILQQVASEKAYANQGKIGHDGKEIQTGHTPRVNGYDFVKTPSPAPGMGDESPLMTWGEIEGTPFRLDGMDNMPLPKTPGPTFKIPEPPKRDRIAFELAEKASKAHRTKKQDALKRVTSNFTSPLSMSPRFGMSATDKLNHMSPAAQRLASHSLRIKSNTDKALRASYSPTPRHAQKSPSFLRPDSKSPGSCSFRSGASSPRTGTPGSAIGIRTPERRTSERTLSKDSDAGVDSNTGNEMTDFPSLTDNLLNLPLRNKAVDFF